MDDVYGKIEIFPDHFQDKKTLEDSSQTRTGTNYSSRSQRHLSTVKRVMGAASILKLFSLQRLPWASNMNPYDEKVELTRAEVEALRQEIIDADERENNLKAQLEHVDAILSSARLSGYLYIRTRWTQLPGEPPILDDGDIDDWLPRFVVLNGSCIFYYLKSTDFSPQDTTLLNNVVEIGSLPPVSRDGDEEKHAFYILTSHGLRFECSSSSKVQVDSWLTTLRDDCKLDGPRLHI